MESFTRRRVSLAFTSARFNKSCPSLCAYVRPLLADRYCSP